MTNERQPTTPRRFVSLAATAALALATGCAGSGDWIVETWGEEYIEEAIPAADVDDGYTIVFDEFLVAIDGVALVDAAGEEVAAIDGQRVFDLARPGPHAVGEAAVAATFYDRVDARVGPASGAEAGNATADQLARMNDGGLSIVAAGTASLGGETFAFDWAFATDTSYACEPALTVAAGGEAATQLTIHGDHLFYDDLEDPDAVVSFGVLAAADADGDGSITRAELEAAPVAPTGFGVGQYAEVTDLWQFVEHLTRTVGHIDGEGHCQVDF